MRHNAGQRKGKSLKAPFYVHVTTLRPKDNCGQWDAVPGTPCNPSSKNSACTACEVYNRGQDGVSRGCDGQLGLCSEMQSNIRILKKRCTEILLFQNLSRPLLHVQLFGESFIIKKFPIVSQGSTHSKYSAMNRGLVDDRLKRYNIISTHRQTTMR